MAPAVAGVSVPADRLILVFILVVVTVLLVVLYRFTRFGLATRAVGDNERAATLAGEIGGEAISFSRLPWALAESDIVISGTGADRFILGPELIAPAVANRNGRELVLIDIAVPRDVDPAVRDIPGVRLFDIDDIQSVSRASMRGRRRQVLRVEAHVEDEVDDFMDWWHSIDVLPVIAALRERAEDVRRREVERIYRAAETLVNA